MCHLNILIKGTELGSRSLCKFLKNVTHSSFQTNRDGDGMYFSGTQTLVKSLNKIKVNKYVPDIKISNFIITHQRISTSGFSGEYTQPFENSDFVIAHNGVMGDFVVTDKDHSDTYDFFDKFKTIYAKQTGTRQKNIVSTIKELLDEQEGSYSIAIYDKMDNSMYYFKNFSTTITFYKSNDSEVLYMTTSWTNDKYLKRLPQSFKEKTIKDHTIYKITIGDTNKISIRKVDTIKDKPIKTYGGFNQKDDYPICDARTTFEQRCAHDDAIKDITRGGGYNRNYNRNYTEYPVCKFTQVDIFLPCLYCEDSTDWMDMDGYSVCRNCQDIHREELQSQSDFNGVPYINGFVDETYEHTEPPQVKSLDKVSEKLEVFKLMYDINALNKRQAKKLSKLVKKKHRLISELEVIADAKQYC